MRFVIIVIVCYVLILKCCGFCWIVWFYLGFVNSSVCVLLVLFGSCGGEDREDWLSESGKSEMYCEWILIKVDWCRLVGGVVGKGGLIGVLWEDLISGWGWDEKRRVWCYVWRGWCWGVEFVVRVCIDDKCWCLCVVLWWGKCGGGGRGSLWVFRMLLFKCKFYVFWKLLKDLLFDEDVFKVWFMKEVFWDYKYLFFYCFDFFGCWWFLFLGGGLFCCVFFRVMRRSFFLLGCEDIWFDFFIVIFFVLLSMWFFYVFCLWVWMDWSSLYLFCFFCVFFFLLYFREYLSCMKFYWWRLWMCKVLGKMNLIYEEVLVFECKVMEKV